MRSIIFIISLLASSYASAEFILPKSLYRCDDGTSLQTLNQDGNLLRIGPNGRRPLQKWEFMFIEFEGPKGKIYVSDPGGSGVVAEAVKGPLANSFKVVNVIADLTENTICTLAP